MSEGGSGKKDLTRWNRAGLQRFRYVDANAATFLEQLRLRFQEAFQPAGGGEEKRWTSLPPDGPRSKSSRERNAWLVAQYQAPRAPVPDWGWEIARTLARACHVLGETLDAHANEGYLGTATQWESVRRLVAMLGYEPTPPASSETLLCIEAKERGRVEKGFPVKYTPSSGKLPTVFETLEDVEVDPALNVIRPDGWDRSPAPLEGSEIDLEGRIDGIVVGEPIVLEGEGSQGLSGHVVKSVLPGTEKTRIEITPPLPKGSSTAPYILGRTIIHSVPRERLRPLGPVKSPAGTELLLERPPDDLSPGDVVVVSVGTWPFFRRVNSIEGRKVVVATALESVDSASAAVLERATVSKMVRLAASGRVTWNGDSDYLKVAGDLSRLIGQTVISKGALPEQPTLESTVLEAYYAPVTLEDTGAANGHPGYTLLKLDPFPADAPEKSPAEIFVCPVGMGTWEVDLALRDEGDAGLPQELKTHLPRRLAAGDLAVVVMGSQASWGRLASVGSNLDEGDATLIPVDEWQGHSTRDYHRASTVVYGHFSVQARAVGWRDNHVSFKDKVVLIDHALAQGGLLQPGRTVIVEKEGDPSVAAANVVEGMIGNELSLRDELPKLMTQGSLRISANVVRAGHGAARPERVLGSGDAARPNQVFILQERGVSFVADPAQPSGVRADVEVRADGRLYSQVGSFFEAGPTDAVFRVQVTEDGDLSFIFGDGQRGRRLPTGYNNVRIRYRVGTGLAGNLPAGSLTKLGHPHAVVASIRQPLPSTGGNDLEGVGSIRERAASPAVALGRCVSLEDFEALARGHSSVWQARAFANPGTARGKGVQVVIVPAGGGEITGISDELKVYLEAHATPGTEVSVVRYESRPVSLDVTLRVSPGAYDPTALVHAALLEAFSLRRRQFGQVLWLSEIYEVVESVSGVENSHCEFSGSDEDNIPPEGSLQIVYLGKLEIATEGSLDMKLGRAGRKP